MKSHAALFRSPDQPLELADIDVDEPEAGEVIVRMVAVGLCGSDLHVVRGEWPRPRPMVLGHEGAGIVESVGEGVDTVAPGDRVVLSWAPSCGACGPCGRGRPAACLRLREAFGKGTMLDGRTGLSLEGEPVYRMTAVGALSERVLVPVDTALPLPDAVPFDQAALLGCAALTGIGAVLNAARLPSGSRVLVFGAGGVGQFIVQGARISGAERIVVVDPFPDRREKAMELGATDVVPPGDVDGLMKRIEPEGADYAFEAVGKPESEAAALRWTRAGGTAVLVGMPAVGAELRVDPFDFAAREKTLTGSIYGSDDPARSLPMLLDLVASGQVQLGPMVGPTFTLDEVNDGIAATLAGEPRRVLIGFPGG
jgi:S-(hydroxymethyl)glutathione dehydrogenase/alcohol dehydrogenase